MIISALSGKVKQATYNNQIYSGGIISILIYTIYHNMSLLIKYFVYFSLKWRTETT